MNILIYIGIYLIGTFCGTILTILIIKIGEKNKKCEAYEEGFRDGLSFNKRKEEE